MKLRAISISLAVLASTLAACIPVKPVEHVDGDWTSALDGDLRVAGAHMDDAFKAKGWNVHVLWIGARGGDYAIERGPTGEPLRKAIEVMYGFQLADGKCYLHGDGVLAHGVLLAREHVGGGHYGEPRVVGYDPMRGDGTPVGRPMACDAAAQAKGGAHAPFAAAAATR